MKQSLNGVWTLEGYLPSACTYNMEAGTGFTVGPLIPAFPAHVPGSVHADLAEAGRIEPPYFEDNVLKCEWVEHKCWKYSRTFDVPESLFAGRARLVFAGLNFSARVYLNGSLVGTHRNVNTPLILDVTGRLCGSNTLVVLLENLPEDESQMGRTSECRYQSQRFGYGWDFCTRLVGVGIFREVYLEFLANASITDTHVSTDYDGEAGWVRAAFSVDAPCAYTAELSFNGNVIAAEEGRAESAGKVCFRVERPQLWYPNTYGDQPLYRLTLTPEGGEPKCFEVGVCRIGYRRCDNAPEDSAPYVPVVNGVDVWLRGTIFLPPDHMLGCITEQRLERWVKRMHECNINLIRLWGGSVAETDAFYSLCDRYGLLVWQDFTQSNSGLDGVPSKHPEFLSELAASSEYLVKLLRNHTCTAFYCGGNELRKDFSVRRVPAGLDDENVAMLADLVRRLDPDRVFYASCPNGPNFSYSAAPEDMLEKRNHNIHGEWAYLGPEAHYRHYNSAEFLYQGEFGVNGAGSERTLRAYFRPETLEKVAQPDWKWYLRNLSWWDTRERDTAIFGTKATESLNGYIAASQLIQAEGLRYIIERNRCRAFACAGNNLWQFNEPWPNLNCTNLVDYGEVPKMAYYTVKNAYAPTVAALRYNALWVKAGSEFRLPVQVNSLSRGGFTGKVTAEGFSEYGKLLFEQVFSADVPAGGTQTVGEISGRVQPSFGRVFFIRLSLGEGSPRGNLYCFGTQEDQPLAALFALSGRLSCRLKDGEAAISNVGDQPCLYLNFCGGGEFSAEESYFTLFPGESIRTRLGERGGGYVQDFAGNTWRLVQA